MDYILTQITDHPYYLLASIVGPIMLRIAYVLFIEDPKHEHLHDHHHKHKHHTK